MAAINFQKSACAHWKDENRTSLIEDEKSRRWGGGFWLGTLNWKCVFVCMCVYPCVESALVTQSSIDKQG